MADTDELALTAVRKWIAEQRPVLLSKFPKNLPQDEYNRHCGRMEMFETFASVVQDAVRKANEVLAEGDDDPDPMH